MTVNSLYTRLGGYDAITAVVDDFSAALINDPKLGVYFKGLCDDSIKHVRQLLSIFYAKLLVVHLIIWVATW